MITNPNEPAYTIGIASKKFGISPETLRLYEREGLLIPHRTDTGRRLYSEVDLEWISCIREQITVNKLNIAGIKRLLALIPCWDLKPCTPEDREFCKAYLSNDQLCWDLDETGKTCQNENCHSCEVYLLASQVGRLKEMFEMQLKKGRVNEG